MKYEVRCECGKAHAVSETDAGASMPCPCGRMVEVPPLHQLRASVGQSLISPVMQLRGMLLRDELPGTTACSNCGCETNHLVRVRIECESITSKSYTSPGAVLMGCFLLGWIGAIFASLISRDSQRPVEYGRDVTFILPVRICEECTPSLNSPDGLKKVLRATPEYSALLDRYPDARIAVLR